MDSTSDLEERLIKLDRDLHQILHLAGRQHIEENIEAEINSLRELVKKIGSHRVEEKDTTLLIREMRERHYDV